MRLMIAAIVLSSCASPDMIDRVTACEQQADAWCPKSGYDTSGCRIAYVETLCARIDRDRPVSEAAQDACLHAIDDMQAPARLEPDVCEMTWPNAIH